MRNIWVIARREYKLYFSTPAAYLVAFMVLITIGIMFVIQLNLAMMQQYAPGIQIVVAPLATLLMLATPAITTRAIATEQRVGTIELLLTAPVRDWELVVGKWLGASLTIFTVIALTLVYPFVLNGLVTPGIDQGVLISSYLGVILLAAALVAIGVFISSLFEHQVAAFIATVAVLLLMWWIVGPVVQYLSSSAFGTVLSYFDLQGPFYKNMLRGVLEVRDIAQYLSVTLLALFLASVSVETRRWR